MAFDIYQADRIRKALSNCGLPLRELKMMGGLCFMVDEIMCCGLLQDKETKEDVLMARVGADYYEEALTKTGAMPMDFTSRPMKGYVFVKAEGFDMEKDLQFWIERCLAFNPLAKRSKKKKR